MPLLARADLRTSLVGSLSVNFEPNSLVNSNYKSDSLNIHTVHDYWQIFGIFGFSLFLVIVIASRAYVGRTSTEHAGRRGDDRPPSTHVGSPRWIPRGAIRTGATRSALARGCIVVSGLQRTTTSENKKKGRRRPSTRPGFTGRLAPRTSPLRLVATAGISGSEAPGEISPPPSDANGDDTHRHAAEPKENERREGTGDLLGEAERALEELGERHAAAAAAADGDEDDDTYANASIEPSASVDDVVLTTDADGNLRFGDKRDKRVVVRNLFRRMRGKEEMSADELAEWNTRNEEKKAAKAAKKAANKKKNATGGKKRGLVARIKARVGGTGKKRRPRKDAFDRELRGEFDKTKLENFFKRRPGQVAARLPRCSESPLA